MNIDMQNAFIAGLASGGVVEQGGAELNLAFGDTAPEDTSKLWIKAARTPSVTVDYNPDNTVETVSSLSTVLPAATGESSGAVVGTKCYLFGGKNSGNSPINTIREFDTETETISTLSATLPTAAAEIGCCVVGTKIYLFGGYGSSYYDTINVFDTETNTLTTLSATLQTAARGFGCASVGTKCYLFGGVKSNGNFLDTINVFDTETNTISTLSATLPLVYCKIGCCAVGTKIYLFGGSGGSPSNLQKAIYVFDTETNTLTTLTAELPQRADSLSCVATGTKCYLLGGAIINNNISKAINVFDTETNTLTTLTDELPQTVAAFNARGLLGNSVYVFGGWTGSANTAAIQKLNITFPLAEGAVFVHEDMLRNKFTLVNEPTKVTVGVSAVSVGNASGYAENCEAYLHDGAGWQPIT